jgi:pSer/pThr/pTyr-binding forkhead associated (FHA) protein
MSGEIILALRIALTATLYIFTGLALWTLWKDLNRQSKQLMAPQAPPLTLIYPQENGRPRSERFTNASLTVGRDPASEVHLEDKTISVHHARLSYHHGQWWVEDLSSTNGTYLNEEPVIAPMVLTAGDLLRFGQVELQVSFTEQGQFESESQK